MSRPASGAPKKDRPRRKYPKLLPKYYNPSEPKEKWSGRGKRPRWLLVALQSGHTLEEFQRIIRTGHDFDQAHPACSTGTLGAQGCILSPPFNADLLQVMPWPTYGNMSDDDIRAIYEYLRAIPCISHKGTVGLPVNLYQVCP